jgi:hypothetical protein
VKTVEDIIASRRTKCSNCDVPGVRVDTEWGEIIEGSVVATIEPNEVTLMSGRKDGTALHLTLCDDCA